MKICIRWKMILLSDYEYIYLNHTENDGHIITMKVLVVEPNRVPYAAETKNSLDEMQKIVGGLIQAVYPFDSPAALICNDEGKLLGLPLNRALRTPDIGMVYDIIAGTFFLCGAPPESEDFTELTDEQITQFMEIFHTSETFLRMGQDILVFSADDAGKEAAV